MESLQLSCGALAAHIFAVVNLNLLTLRTRISQAVGISAALSHIRRVLQGLDGLVGHIPVGRTGIGILNLHFQGNAVAGLHIAGLVRQGAGIKIADNLFPVKFGPPAVLTLQFFRMGCKTSARQHHQCHRKAQYFFLHLLVPPLNFLTHW